MDHLFVGPLAQVEAHGDASRKDRSTGLCGGLAGSGEIWRALSFDTAKQRKDM